MSSIRIFQYAYFSSSEESDVVDHKRRHRKKSKKLGKSKSKKRDVSSDSDSDTSSSSSSTEEETKKRKKHKKTKKSKRKSRHDSAAGESDVQATKETHKVLYISSEDEAHLNSKKLKRIDELKKLRGSQQGDREAKSKWDSPSEEFDRKRWVDYCFFLFGSIWY